MSAASWQQQQQQQPPPPARAAVPPVASRTPAGGPPRSTCFPEVPRGASAARVAAPPTEYWAVHGMYYRIPPLYDQLRSVRAEQPPGWSSYTQWAQSFRPGAGSAGGGRGPPGAMPASRGSLAALRQPQSAGPSVMMPLLPGEDEDMPSNDPRREEFERWRACWKTIVKRDIPRHQRTILTQQKDTLAGCKRASLTVQKEVRRRAMRAQRLAMSSQIQIKCKKLVRDMGPAYKESETAREAARKEEARLAWRAQQPSDRFVPSQAPKRKAPPQKPPSEPPASRARPAPSPSAQPAGGAERRPASMTSAPASMASAASSALSASPGVAFDSVHLKLRGVSGP